uniref:Transmembrane protein n=1 Tax=Spongospora subterranea TaxID=70186 RepID=A0A0H5R459_9EUKA|eukprot:CRZ08928.1 hypothetical protein [Spongospora subterranea]
MNARAAYLLIASLLIVSAVLIAAEPKAKSEPKASTSLVQRATGYVVKIQAKVNSVALNVKDVYEKDQSVVYALVAAGFVLGVVAVYVLSSSSKSSHRKPSGFKRKQK